jgi:hypothetical protein
MTAPEAKSPFGQIFQTTHAKLKADLDALSTALDPVGAAESDVLADSQEIGEDAWISSSCL